ncbi:MAG TPA: hypothetical protein VGI85_10330 [Chthoniobacterales bacterium]|jgi:2-polyprenyl-6-methoxyphenol hydroxylase-like FAD-dependent oxidoreductase
MALEDALVLAKCLASHDCRATALRRYEALRFRRTRGIQRRSRWIGQIGQWQSPLLVRSRNYVTRLLPSQVLELNLRRTYAYTT